MGKSVSLRSPVSSRVLLAATTTPDDRKSLCCARSLGRAGAWVAVGGDALRGQAFYSRFVSHRVRYPHPRLGIPAFVAAINAAVERDRYELILSMSDYTTVALARHREALHPAVATVLPAVAALEVASDKARTLALARRLGIEAPETHEIESEDRLREVAAGVGYPCVMKLRRGSGSVGFRVLADRDELLAAYRTPREPSDLAFDRDVLVQEYVPGQTHDACVLFRHGEPRAGLTQRRVRTYPREGGVGTLVESTREPELLDRACRLLGELGWHGPAQVEFKVDRESGRTWLIEINGRFWGTLAAAVEAGIDFPQLACRLALGEDVPPAFDYAVGQRYRFPFPFGLLALGDGGFRWRAARDFFAPSRAVRSDLEWRDPRPHLAEAAYLARRAWARRSLRPGRGRPRLSEPPDPA